MSRRSDDLFAGLLFLAVAAFFGFTALRTLEVGSAGTMGPGYFPILMSLVLAIVGIVIIVRMKPPAGERRPMPWRGLLFVVAAPVAFGLTVRTLGLLPALLITVTLSVLASRNMTLVRGIKIVVGITIFCIAIFSWGIGLTVPLISPDLLP